MSDDDLMPIIEAGVLAEQAALENYVQGYLADAIDADLKFGFAKYLAEAHKEHSQPDRAFAKDKERFERFRLWCQQDELQYLPAADPIVFSYLIGLAAKGGSTLQQIKRAATAIQNAHHMAGWHVSEIYLTAAMAACADILKGPEGGSRISGGLSAPASPMAMAASAES
jgi:hypothetical protein